MAKFRNILTGVIWEISNPDHIARLASDKDYEPAEDTTPAAPQTPVNEPNGEPEPEPEPETDPLADLTVAQLKEVATSLGIEFKSKATHPELVALITAHNQE